jgi:hypothetical protein
MRRKVTVYLNDEELGQLRREAGRGRISLSRYLKERMLTPEFAASGAAVCAGPEIEKRVSEAVRGAVKGVNQEVLEQLNALVLMVDEFVLRALIQLPEIPAAQQQERAAAGARRHRDWQEKVEELIEQSRAQAAGQQPASNGNGVHA